MLFSRSGNKEIEAGVKSLKFERYLFDFKLFVFCFSLAAVSFRLKLLAL